MCMDTNATTRQIGTRIATIRKRRQMSQATLGKSAGVGKEMICRYERGRVQPRVDTLAKIATALGVPIDSLA